MRLLITAVWPFAPPMELSAVKGPKLLDVS